MKLPNMLARFFILSLLLATFGQSPSMASGNAIEKLGELKACTSELVGYHAKKMSVSKKQFCEEMKSRTDILDVMYVLHRFNRKCKSKAPAVDDTSKLLETNASLLVVCAKIEANLESPK